jgi:hypothetical protein
MINKMWFCNHQYEILEECRIKDPAYKDFIVGIVYILRCKKCGKIKKKKITL